MMPTDVIAVDYLQLVENDEVSDRKSVLSFYPRNPAFSDAAYGIMRLPGRFHVREVVAVRDQHIVALCSDLTQTEGVENAADPNEGIQSDTVQGLVAVIIHVSSRREIGRVAWRGPIQRTAKYALVSSCPTLPLARWDLPSTQEGSF